MKNILTEILNNETVKSYLNSFEYEVKGITENNRIELFDKQTGETKIKEIGEIINTFKEHLKFRIYENKEDINAKNDLEIMDNLFEDKYILDEDLDIELDKLAKGLVDTAFSNIDSEESNYGATHYDYYLDEYPLIENFINNNCDYDYGEFDLILSEHIMKDERVLQCDIGCIEYYTVEVVFKDEYLGDE